MKRDKRPPKEIWADMNMFQKFFSVALLGIILILIFAVIVSSIIGIDCALFFAISYLFGFEFDFIKAILCTPIWFLISVWISRNV